MTDDELLDRLIAEAGDAIVEKNASQLLNTDVSGVSVPKSLDRKIKKLINSAENAPQTECADSHSRHAFSAKNRRRPKFGKRTAVIIIAALAACTVTVYAVVEKFWNGRMKFYDDYIDVKYNMPQTPHPSAIEIKYEPAVPEEWEKKICIDNEFWYSVTYYENGKEIASYSQKVISNADNIAIDNENTVVEDIIIDDNAGKLFILVDKKSYIALWNDGEYRYMIDVNSDMCTREDLVEIANSIK